MRSILAKGRALLPSLVLLGLAFLLLTPAKAYPTRAVHDREIAAYGNGPFLIADLTGDGWPDLAAADDAGQAVWIYTGSPQGLPPSPSFRVPVPGVLDLAVAALDGNGRPELLAADGSHVLAISYSGDAWTPVVVLSSQGARAIAAGDFDDDGRTDLAILGPTGASIWFQQVGIQRFNATASVPLSPAITFQSLVVGDLNGDGRDDIALAKPYEIEVYLQGSQGPNLQPIDFTTKSTGGAVSLAIVPSKGLPYLANLNSGQGGGIGLWRWDGSSFEASPALDGSFSTNVAIGDVNDDRQADIAVVTTDGSVDVFLQRAGTFGGAPDLILQGAGNPYERVGMGDVNADGFPDVLVRAPGMFLVFLQEDAMPILIRAIPSIYVVNRGTFTRSVVDLRQFFVDDHNRLTFSVLFESDPAHLHAATDGTTLDFEARGTWYGTAQFRVGAWDGNPSHATIESNLFTVLVNDPPRITSAPGLRAVVGQSYTYVVAVQDVYPASDSHSFGLRAAPDGMTIDGATGLVAWTPSAAQEGSNDVAVTVRDANGGVTVQQFAIVVAAAGAGSPLIMMAVGVAASSAALLAAAALLNENARYLFLLFFVPLYTKIKRERVLDHFVRGQIFGYIQANPGEHYNAIKEALGLTNGSLAHHLRTLEREQFIKSKRYGLYRRFYPMNFRMPADDVYQPNEIQTTILAVIRAHPGITQKEIAGRLGLTPPTVNYHISVLNDRHLIRVDRVGRSTHCSIVEGTQT